MKDKAKELEDAVCTVIQIIKQIPELADTRLAVVGDLALWHYLRDRRPAHSVDVVTSLPTLKFLKGKLLQHPNLPFTYDKKGLLYHSPAGWDIPIQMVSKCLCPRIWDAEYLVKDMPHGQVPYLSVEGMAMLKIESAQSRDLSPDQKHQDMEDAAALMDFELARQPPTERPAPVDDETEANETVVAGPSAPKSNKQQGLDNEALRETQSTTYETVAVQTKARKTLKCFHIKYTRVRVRMR
ncbi:hypothetical protein F4678DRAFT_388805 [Xylaria arbuscula]|nr:hypothetical protein F4678DRAFT_388805 [Xylaria arbuscula]